MNIHFEWDAAKAAANLRKHGIGFELAVLIFSDPLLVSHQDRIEGSEYRWQSLGLVDGQLLLLVAHTVRDEHSVEIVRIISARRATRKEKRHYEQENG